MTDERRIKLADTCRVIAADMKRDATDFEGRPFTGKTVAEALGNQGAAIAALATFLAEALDGDHEDR